MADPAPPIVIDGDGQIEVYQTVLEARRAVEVVDVADGLYQAFDSEGCPLRLVAHGDLVLIELPSDSRPDQAELEHRLLSHSR